MSASPAAGLTSSAMLVAVGANSCSSSTRFGPTSAVNDVTPVRLPPGRARLVTSPPATGSYARTAAIPHPMQSLCTLRSHCRQWPRNTRYQAGRYPLLGPDFHQLDHTSLRLAHLLDHLVGAGEDFDQTEQDQIVF